MEGFVVKKKSRMSSLEDVSPTDAVFEAALESDEQLFPPTLEEKEDVQKKQAAAKLCYDDAQSDDDFAGAQKLNLIAENAKLLVDEKTSKYEKTSAWVQLLHRDLQQPGRQTLRAEAHLPRRHCVQPSQDHVNGGK
jgi:hypothetical protein